MDTIISDECISGKGSRLKSKHKAVICSLISNWYEKLDQSIKHNELFEIKEIIIKPEFLWQFYTISIHITFNFILPNYSFNFSKERQLTIFRENKAVTEKITQKDFDTTLNEFLLNEIRKMKEKIDKHQEAFEKMLSVL